MIKDPFDPPGPPGLPEITDWSEKHVKLKWTPPIRENGAPVTHYTIEFREAGEEKWTVGPKVKAKKYPDGVVQEGLTPGKKYEFRVKAENKAGMQVLCSISHFKMLNNNPSFDSVLTFKYIEFRVIVTFLFCKSIT